MASFWKCSDTRELPRGQRELPVNLYKIRRCGRPRKQLVNLKYGKLKMNYYVNVESFCYKAINLQTVVCVVDRYVSSYARELNDESAMR